MNAKKAALLNQYLQCLQMRNYADSTIKSYYNALSLYYSWCEKQVSSNPHFDKANAPQAYLAWRMKVLHLDFSTVNNDYTAIRHFYKFVLDRPWSIRKLPRPRKEKRLPKYLSPQQVALLLNHTKFPKYKIIFLLFYATGIRLTELRSLQWENLDIDQRTILIKNGKGHKDRFVVLHLDIYAMLLQFKPTEALPTDYIFYGYKPTEKLAARTLQYAFITTRRSAKLPEWVSAHTLRHSFATALLKNGTDLVTIQKLMGHKYIKTTLTYLHLDAQHFQSTYNPLSDPCLNVSNQTAAVLTTPLEIVSDSTDQNTSV